MDKGLEDPDKIIKFSKKVEEAKKFLNKHKDYIEREGLPTHTIELRNSIKNLEEIHKKLEKIKEEISKNRDRDTGIKHKLFKKAIPISKLAVATVFVVFNDLNNAILLILDGISDILSC